MSTTFTWDAGDGTSTGDWTTPANWDQDSSYPQAGDTAIFPAGKHKCYVNAPITCTTVTVAGDAADTVLELQAALTITGDLTITSGIMDTGADHALTVTGDTTGAGTLTLNSSTYTGGGSGSNLSLLGTLSIGTSGVITNVDQLGENGSGGGTVTCTGSPTLGHRRIRILEAKWTKATSTLKMEDGNDAIYGNATTYAIPYNFELANSGTTEIAGAYTVTGNLTITSGTLDTTSSNHALTVTGGNLSVSGTLLLNNSTVVVSDTDSALSIGNTGTVTCGDTNLTVNALSLGQGPFTAPSASGSFIITGEKSGFAFDYDGNQFIHNSGTIEIRTAAATKLDFVPNDGSTDINNVKINHASCDAFIEGNTSIAGNLEITLGKLTCTTQAGDARTLTVDGTTTIGPNSGAADQATLTATSQDLVLGSGRQQADYAVNIEIGGTFVGGTGTHTVGSLYMAQSANAKATMTTGVMTINGYNNSANKAWRVEYGGDTFDNANGTVRFNFNGFDTRMSMRSESHANNAFHNLIIAMAADTRTLSIDNGTDVKVDNDLTISRGILNAGSNHNLEVVGDVDVGSASEVSNLKFSSSSTKTGTFGSLTIGADGTYEATSGTTTIKGNASSSANLAWANSGTFTHNSGTVLFDGTNTFGGSSFGHINPATNTFNNLTINADSKVLQLRGNSTTLTVAGDLTMTDGTLMNYGTNTVTTTVTGDVSIANGATIGANTGGNDMTAPLNFGSLTIDNGGTFIATSGTTTLNGDFDNTGTFTHNSGLVSMIASGGNITINGTGTVEPVFHDLSYEGSSDVRVAKDITVEDTLNINGSRFLFGSTSGGGQTDAILTMGTTSTKGTLTVQSGKTFDFYIYSNSQTDKLQGASTLFPVDVTVNGTMNFSVTTSEPDTGKVQLANINYIGSLTLDNGDKVELTGDCEFDAVTVSTGATLDLNGQRMEMSGTLTNNGTIDYDGSLFTPLIDDDGTANNTATCDLTFTGSGAYDLNGTYRTLFFNGAAEYNPANTLGLSATNCIIAQASDGVDLDGTAQSCTNLTITTGGTLEPNAATITVSGDFNMAGGLIGKSALLCSGAHWASGASVLNYSSTDVTAISIGAWVKNIDIANGDGNQMILRQNDNFIAVQSDGSLYVGVEVSQANGTSWDYPGVVTDNGTISDDNKWHHISMTWASGSTLKAYLDGKLVGEKTDIGAEYVKLRPRAAAQPVGVGAYQGNSEYEGTIAQACRWHTELSESDIRTHIFQDFSSLASTTNLIYWYQFDSANGTAILDSSTNDCDLTSVTVASNTAEAAWVGPGTYTYGTSTLKFDNAGTCNLTGHQDATATQLHSIHITSGTTVAANCRVNDFVMNSGSVMTNSGTLTSNRNWQYKSRNMPIVGPNSDLKVSTNIWYYMSDGSGLPASGAGTDYYQLRPATNVYMQGDFDCQNGLLQSGGDLHLNGYACSTSKIWNYGGGNIHADAGSSIVFDTEYGFNVSYGENPTTMFFVASGIAGANFQGMSNSNRGKFDMHDDTNFAAVANGGPYSGSASFSYWVYLPPNVSGTLKANNVGYFGGGGGGQTGGGFCSWSYQAYNPYGGIYWDVAGEEYAQRSSNSYNWTDGDIGKLHHIVNVLDRTSGTAAGEGNLQIWVDGAMVASGNVQTSTPFTAVSSSAGFNWAIGHGNLSWPATSSTGPSMMISDFRIYKGGQDGVAGALTPENIQTLYNSGNTIIDGTGADYSDPDNALGAATWYKLDRTSAGLTSLVDSVSGSNGHYDQNYAGKTGFVTISGTTTPYNPVNNLYPAGVTLKNVYISGSKDIVAGQRKENSAGFMAVPSQIIKTEGTVILD